MIDNDLHKLKEMFTDGSVVGGSYALSKIRPNLRIVPNDIDLFIKNPAMTTNYLVKFIHSMFPEYIVCNYPESEGKYNMPDIVRRIAIHREGQIPIDIVCVRAENVSEWSLKHQASCLTEALLVLSFNDRGYYVRTSKDFEDACKGNLAVVVRRNLCTDEHLQKLQKFGKYLDLKY